MKRRLIALVALALLGLAAPAEAGHPCFPCLHQCLHHSSSTTVTGQSNGVQSFGVGPVQSFGVHSFGVGPVQSFGVGPVQSFGVHSFGVGPVQSFGVHSFGVGPVQSFGLTSSGTSSGTTANADAVSASNILTLLQRGCQIVNPGSGTASADATKVAASIDALKTEITNLRTQQADILAEIRAIRVGNKFDPPPKPKTTSGSGTQEKLGKQEPGLESQAPRSAPTYATLDRNLSEIAAIQQRTADHRAVGMAKAAPATTQEKGLESPAPQSAPTYATVDRNLSEIAAIQQRTADRRAEAKAKAAPTATLVASSPR